ncbi:hypothetical protein [Ohtaekwangia koreensis]|uniref:hypothetical protein n=1 Tax=Ohtaekwangia koreensis TaxID=688867 RepID=UPI00117F5EE3|nr:hypothetical protein [Ohtaekwangia koreensis]
MERLYHHSTTVPSVCLFTGIIILAWLYACMPQRKENALTEILYNRFSSNLTVGFAIGFDLIYLHSYKILHVLPRPQNASRVYDYLEPGITSSDYRLFCYQKTQ